MEKCARTPIYYTTEDRFGFIAETKTKGWTRKWFFELCSQALLLTTERPEPPGYYRRSEVSYNIEGKIA